jgi:hypothetical protein
MSRPLAEILSDLERVDLGDPYLIRLTAICDELRQSEDGAAALEPVFRFMEANGDRELGAPGPLVHFIEGVPGFERALLRSLERAPTTHTVWMLNRMINVANDDEVQALLDLMRRIASTSEDDAVRREAIEFLEFQEG